MDRVLLKLRVPADALDVIEGVTACLGWAAVVGAIFMMAY